MSVISVCRNLKKFYGEKKAVGDVSFDVHAGEIVILVGPNGSGKTTTMEMLVGLRKPTAGTASIEGIRVRPGGPHRFAVGVQLQQSGLPSRLRVNEALRSAAALYTSPRDSEELLGAVGLEDKRSAYVDKLSGGQQRRLDVALACIGRSPLLVLDEPTSGLDPEGRAELWMLLRSLAREGHGILASTHDLAEAEAFADRVIVLREGELVLSGKIADVLASAGGEWRLRITDPDREAMTILGESGLRTVNSGSQAITLGSRVDIEDLRDRLGAATSSKDILSGPVRLEDLFLFAKKADAQ